MIVHFTDRRATVDFDNKKDELQYHTILRRGMHKSHKPGKRRELAICGQYINYGINAPLEAIVVKAHSPQSTVDEKLGRALS